MVQTQETAQEGYSTKDTVASLALVRWLLTLQVTGKAGWYCKPTSKGIPTSPLDTFMDLSSLPTA